MNRLRAIATALTLAAAAVIIPASSAPATGGTVWSATWGTSQELALTESWSSQDLRMVARTSLGGDQLRIHLANTFATVAATFTHVTVAVQQAGPTALATPVTATFGGSQSVTIAAGASVVSDPVAITVAAGTRLLVSLYIPASTTITSAPVHQLPGNTEYNYYGADETGQAAYSVSNTFGFTSYLTSIDVGTAAPATVAAVGDSITDGVAATVDADARWPDYLSDRVGAAGLAVVNEGINGDWVTADNPGTPGMTSRWLRDVLSLAGLRTIIDQGGINDLRNGVTAAALESAQTTLVGQAHNAGVRVLLATITPCSGYSGCTAGFETQRQAYNAWVRAGGGAADGVVDFDAAVGNGAALASAYDSGDHIHPGPAGYAVMANIIDPSRL